ncbi:thiamine pyrophosphate-binding protein [Halorubrum aethiopicum]|uniref:thiamine pyrophosphate-binding protein n=1 Tax=Halorubrum aethiopicum TaxID=1758255 RepID=UPI00082ABB9E|nr:thiamine pyrophosphate-binding protein [Halorubrum aethiopicum]
MTRTGADLFVEALETYGVPYLFGNPGTTEVPVMSALEGSKVDYVLGLQEDIAVGMAAGYACTRRQRGDEYPLGVVNLHVAPGMAHGLGNLYAASVSGAPLVITAGTHSMRHQHEEPILYGDLVEMTQQFTKWSAEVKAVESLPTMLRRACKVALTPPMGPVFLGFPMDVMLRETNMPVEPLEIPKTGRGDTHAIAQAADVLTEADEPVLIVGDQIARGGQPTVEAVIELAEQTGARVHSEILSTEVNFPMDHELWVSHMPESFAEARALHEADAVVLIGCTTHTPTLAHDEPLVPSNATAVHIGPDSWELAKNEPASVVISGALRPTIKDLTRRISGRVSDEQLTARRKKISEIRDWVGENLQQSPSDNSDAISKTELIETMEKAVPDAYIVDESVTTRYALLSEWDLQPGQLFGNKSGGLGYGLPAAVGAALAEDDRPVVGLLGDGSYLYYPHSMYTAARYDLDLTIVISNNQNYRILKDNALKILGGDDDDHEFIGMDLQPGVDFTVNASSHGVEGGQITDKETLEAMLREAANTSGPSVLDVRVVD